MYIIIIIVILVIRSHPFPGRQNVQNGVKQSVVPHIIKKEKKPFAARQICSDSPPKGKHTTLLLKNIFSRLPAAHILPRYYYYNKS